MAKQEKPQPTNSDDKVRTKRHQEYLEYRFSDPELKSIGKDLARENQQLKKIEYEKTKIVSSLKSQAADCEAEISKFSRWLSEGSDYRHIDCETRFHVPVNGIKRTIRLDTGEVVRETKMELHELQDPLFPEPPAQKTNGVEAKA